VLAHMTLPTVFKLWPSRPHLSFPSTSRLSHIITIYHVYIVTSLIKQELKIYTSYNT
jgi:hypothetical protein